MKHTPFQKEWYEEELMRTLDEKAVYKWKSPYMG